MFENDTPININSMPIDDVWKLVKDPPWVQRTKSKGKVELC